MISKGNSENLEEKKAAKEKLAGVFKKWISAISNFFLMTALLWIVWPTVFPDRPMTYFTAVLIVILINGLKRKIS